ncbi:MAG TPA: DNA-binding response regulator [Desulfosporosinus sp.]|nr:DNA-binding response regulator [Desulfosporosinus sp.]
MKLRALLIDDERTALEELRYLLQPFEDVEVVGEATNAPEALELICHQDYSVIFLGLFMPSLNWVDLANLSRKKPNSPAIIFITANAEYGFAFALNALDYLLKPIHPKRLEEALTKVRQFQGILSIPKSNPLPSVRNGVIEPSPPMRLEVVPVEHRGKIVLLHQKDIIFIYTNNGNVYIKTQKDSYLTLFTLQELELRLSSTLFFRSHRCYIVNVSRMRELIPYFNGTYTIVVDDHEGSQIPMSRTKSRILKEMLGL